MSDDPDSLSNPPLWYREIYPGGARTGFYQAMADHGLVFVDRKSDVLVVSFDNLAEAGGTHYARDPWASKFVYKNGWDQLGVFSNGPTWFRDPELIDRLERMRDEGFFRNYKKVVMCGASMGGFAALTFAPLAPGSTAIAFSPQSTLAEDLVPWETRFRKSREQDWTIPYSDAADGIHEAGRAYVIYDPYESLDRKHIDRLASDKLVELRAPGCGHKSALVMRRMDTLKEIMQTAVEGSLTQPLFANIIKKRKSLYLYRKTMEQHLLDRNQTERAARFTKAFKKHR